MRTIKFRGKRIDNGEWIIGDLIQSNNGVIQILPIESDIFFNNEVVDPETVGQFTGLFDKNGKEIFEGDIVKFIINNWKEEIYVAIVVWGEKSHGYSLKVDTKLYNKWGRVKYYSLPCSKNIEIVSNAIDNPESLKN